MRSRTGCLTCRQRKLKCDERKPVCSQCTKANRQCRFGEGVVFRHQQNASMNGAGGSSVPVANSLGRFYSYKNTFNKDTTWLEIPKTIRFVDNSDPYNQDLDDVPPPPDQDPTFDHDSSAWSLENIYQSASVDMPGHGLGMPTHGLEALSAAATRDQYSGMPPSTESSIARSAISYAQNQLSPNEQLSPAKRAHHQSENVSDAINDQNNQLHFMLNPSAATSPPIDPNLHSPITTHDAFLDPALSASDPTQVNKGDIPVERDQEVAYLLRHFSETPGQWMDLFDPTSYFSSYVPVKALSNPLLKYACCAYAAQHLALLKRANSISARTTLTIARPGWSDDWETVNWQGYAAEYYEKAVQILLPHFQDPHLQEITGTRSDDVLAASSIVSLYEFLEGSAWAWSHRLSGAKLLMNITEVSKLSYDHILLANMRQMATIRNDFPNAFSASFWYFVRQDMLRSFINETTTRIDSEKLETWRAAGLRIDDDGLIRIKDDSDGPGEGQSMKHDMISNALVWLLSRIVNFLAVGDNVYIGEEQGQRSTPFAVSQESLLNRWERLKHELDVWYEQLPDVFHPTIRVDIRPFPEVWYNIPMCAATMQQYHFARILLAINKPHESTARRSTVTRRLKSYQSIKEDIRYHSHEICAISRSRPEGSVRVYSVQPLFVAGQALEDAQSRETILELLRGIETELGWPTEYRVQQLLQEWSAG